MSSGERKLYGFQPSPPVRAVLLTLKALDLDYTFETINPMHKDQLTPEYLKKNPQHTIPTLEEPDGRCLWDSHAICAYLVRRYGINDSLYPKDYYQRAVVDQRLHFENGVLFSDCLRLTIAPMFTGSMSKAALGERLIKIHETYDLLEKFLANNDYMAGGTLTIADFSIVTSVTTLTIVAPITADKWPKLAAWLERMSTLPYFADGNTMGLDMFKNFIKDKLAEIK